MMTVNILDKSDNFSRADIFVGWGCNGDNISIGTVGDGDKI